MDPKCPGDEPEASCMPGKQAFCHLSPSLNLTFSVVLFVLRKDEDRVSNGCGNDFFCKISVLTSPHPPKKNPKYTESGRGCLIPSERLLGRLLATEAEHCFHQLLHFSPNVRLRKRPEKNLRNLKAYVMRIVLILLVTTRTSSW